MNTRSALLLAAALFVCASTFAGEPDYTVKAPDGWKKRTASAAPEHYMKNGVSLLVTIDSAPSQVKGIDAYVDFVKTQLSTTFKNIQFEPVAKLTINGNDARELRYTAQTSGITMKYDVVYVPRGSRVYTLTAGGMSDTFDAMKADYKAFFNSFKFK